MPHGGIFIVVSAAGERRDLSRGTREQPFWDNHAAFIDPLVEAGFILLGGSLPDEGGAFMVVRGASEEAIREVLRDDPWYVQDVLRLVSVSRWEVFVDRWNGGSPG